MKTSKKNLITEINRIHQLMGVKKVILESRKILVPLLQVAQEIVEFAAKRNLDDATRRSVSELNSGFKGIVDAEGNRIPLTAEDYVKIFDNLKKSSDPAIVAKVAEMDQKIVSAIQDNMSELITPEIKTLVKQYLDAGGNEDYVVREFQKIFRNTPYGKYADFVTVADDAGNVIETLLDDYLKEIRKVYGDLGGKLDNVIDDTGGTTGGQIARDIVELSPVFTRYTNQVGEKMKPLLDEVMSKIEKRTSPNLTDAEKQGLDELDREIKTLMEEINDLNSEYVEALESQIKYGRELGPVENRRRWSDINKYVEDVKTKYGEWGVTRATTPKSELWIWIDETWYASKSFERSIGNFIRGIKNWKEEGSKAIFRGKAAAEKADGIREKMVAYERDVNSDLAAKVVWWQKYLIPGSSRGIPQKLKGPSGTKLYYPNAYGEIIKYSTKNKMLKAWLSWFAEKLIIVAKSQIYYSLIIPFVRLAQFVNADWGDKNIEKKYGGCIKEASKAIKDGKMNWDDYDPESMTEEDFNKLFSEFPPCLQTLMKSPEFRENEYEYFMTRAEFWSRGKREEALGSYALEGLLNFEMYDPVRILTSTFGNAVIKFFPELREGFWKFAETGDMTQLEQLVVEEEQQLQADTTEVDNQADTLFQNMTDKEIAETARILDSLSQNSGQEITPIPSRNQ
jgi:hypothetical protein